MVQTRMDYVKKWVRMINITAEVGELLEQDKQRGEVIVMNDIWREVGRLPDWIKNQIVIKD